MNKTLITALIVLVIAGGAGFFGGMKYQQSKAPTRQFSNFAGRNGGSGNIFRPVNGQILSNSNNTLTVKLADGTSKVVILTGSTQINKAALGTVTDLVTGSTVAVFGQTNSDGSVTAQSIQINPMVRGNNQPQGQ